MQRPPIGIWCIVDDPHCGVHTPAVDSDFGRWVASIVKGVSNARRPIILWTTKSARPHYEKAFANTRLTIAPKAPPPVEPPPPPPPIPEWITYELSDPRQGEYYGSRPEVLFGPEGETVAGAKRIVRTILSPFGRRRYLPIKLTLAAVLWPIVVFIVYPISLFLYGVSAPFCHRHRNICRERMKEVAKHIPPPPPPWVPPPPEPEISSLPDDLGVDLWIAPSPACTLPKTLPFVQLVPKLPYYDAADRVDPGHALATDRQLRDKATHSLLIANPCPFDLDVTLPRRLGIAPRKLRRCPPRANGATPLAVAPTYPGKRILVCPTFDGGDEENLEALFLAFAKLRSRPGNRDINLVVTGLERSFDHYPQPITALLLHRLDPYVHNVGVLSPDALATLLRQSHGAIFPQLWATSSRPVRHALQHGAVACADVPCFADVRDAALPFPPRDPEALAEVLQNLLADGAEIHRRQQSLLSNLPEPTQPATVSWPDLLDEAETIRERGPAVLYPVGEREPYRLMLVLQKPIPGGTWESAREIVEGLAEVNRRRGRFELSFAYHPDQPGIESLRADGVVRGPRVVTDLPAQDLAPLLGKNIAKNPDARFAYFADLGREATLHQDALFFLAADVPARIAPIRPYGVLVLDVVPFQLGDRLSPDAVGHCRDAIGPTLEAAQLLVTTNDATRRLVREHCRVDDRKLALAPIGCETYRRFAEATPVPVSELHGRPFLLNFTNASPHKGAADVVDGFAILKRRLGDRCPALVFAGSKTDEFVSTAPPSSPYIAEVRRRIAAANLVAGHDVIGLGMIADAQATWLYQNSRVVVNAAHTDNGTYCLIEARYFGRPVVCSDYPAARWLYDRFGVAPRYFPVGDAAALADRLVQTLDDPILTGDDLIAERRRLEADEFSKSRFAERLYEYLLKLAATSREERVSRMPLAPTEQRALVRLAQPEPQEATPCR